MAKHRAVIIGAGRIGAGYNWPQHSFVYTHADAYLKLKDRVELVGFVEPNITRATAALKKYPGTKHWMTVETAVLSEKPDILSMCVPPDKQQETFAFVPHNIVKGVWCEKPWMLGPGYGEWACQIQVNYIRRFDTLHNEVYGKIMDRRDIGDPLVLVVMAKPGLETECHFTDLAKWWNVQLEYIPVVGAEYVNTEYELICTKGKVKFHQGGMSATLYTVGPSSWFPGALVPDSKGKIATNAPKIFMEVALSNLLDAVEGKAELKSPPY